MENYTESLIKRIEDVLTRIACNSYNDMYSSCDYIYANKYLEASLASLLSVAKDLNIDTTKIKSSWCGYEVEAKEFEDFEEYVKSL